RPGDLAILVYRSTDPSLDIGRVAAALDRRGWLPGRQKSPDGMHLHLNPIHAGVIEAYLSDLRGAVAEARQGAAAPVVAATY
ncbi:MAG TPA: hypothetical protein VD970_14125, partial [Acetobacteraceae bacterium]|nr:hypothetical protein [Acetobacteraceae bacterium]